MKEVAKKETSAVAIPDAFKKKSNESSLIDKADIMIPRLLVMQGLSEFVAEEKAQMGDIVNSVTVEVLGGKSKAVKFIPLSHFKTVAYYRVEAQGQPPVYERTEAWNPKTHANLEWEQVIDGKKYVVNQCLNFYVMLERDMENPAAFPYLLTFRRTSYKNGKKLINHFMQMDMMGVEPWFGVLELTSLKQVNDSGTFYVFDVKPVGQSEAKWVDKLRGWSETLAKGVHIVDEEKEEKIVQGSTKTRPGEVSKEAQF